MLIVLNICVQLHLRQDVHISDFIFLLSGSVVLSNEDIEFHINNNLFQRIIRSLAPLCSAHIKIFERHISLSLFSARCWALVGLSSSLQLQHENYFAHLR